MKLAISYDANGEILTMFDPEKLVTAKFSTRYVPAPGERHEIVELPKEFEKEPLPTLSSILRVHVDASGAKLQRK